MKKMLFVLTAALAAMSLFAAPVDQRAALNKAKNYLASAYSGRVMSPAALQPVLLKAEMGENKLNQPVYYIYNTATTFLVIAGDDRAEEILMVGDAPLKDINNLPTGMLDVLGIYKSEISFLQDHPDMKVNPIPSPKNTPQLKAVSVGPLLTALWDQMAPYWNKCTFTYNNRTYQCLTGCPATSASMVLYYWKYPTSVAALPSYTASLELSYYNKVNFTYPALPATTFDWANMKDSYSSYNTSQGNAVATLMRYVGQAENMMYGTEAAGGSGIYVGENHKIADMFKLFGYKSTAQNVEKSNYSAANWASLIQNELIAGRPLVYCAVSSSAGGHAFNVDGYRDSDNKYHVNWGWSGDGNTWCVMNSFSDGSYTFNQSQQAIIGVEPPSVPTVTPELSVSPTSLSFTGYTGQTYTKTFTVSGTNLTGNVTITSNNSTFTVSPATLTAAQAMAGATVTVTYSPTATGTKTGTITVASSGATSKTVSVTGTATAQSPTITVDPTSLSFSTTVGTPVSKTFHLKGINLTRLVTLSVTGSFTLSQTQVLTTTANNGVDITVTYNPTTAGTHSGTITLASTGAETVTIPLTGTAAGVPTINVNPTSLSFTTVVGTPVTKTFEVSGTDLTGNVSLSVSGTGFTINKTSINKNTATSGTTVTVTYSPTTGGSSTGTVTLTSNGAQTVTVSLSGVATTVPTITANPTSLNFTTLVGMPATQTFVIGASNLEGNVTLAVEGEGFAIDKTSIAAGQANNATVTVTYTPTSYGSHSGTVTMTSPNAQPVTITLNGQANLEKYAPVMLPAVEKYINLTKFRADWTDQTPVENVASYTLEVNIKADEPEPEPELIGSIVGTDFSGSATGYYSITLPAPWGGANVRGGLNSIIYFRSNYNGDGSYGNITYTIPAGYENAVFTVKLTTATTSDGSGNLEVTTPSTSTVNHFFTAGETYSWLVTASAGEKIVITTPDDNYSPDIAKIEIYSGNATEAMLRANETGDENSRIITGITDRYYTVTDLLANGTFQYKVKAIYLDGSESEWSNIEEVTLFENGHEYQLGDANHDNKVNITDVMLMINFLSNEGVELCDICADMNGDGNVNVTDVIILINSISSSTNIANLRMMHPSGK